jgi:hypothetical protein
VDAGVGAHARVADLTGGRCGGGAVMDIREYVRVRIIPGGQLSDCTYLPGLMLRKNVAHKAMRREAASPRILCIDGMPIPP